MRQIYLDYNATTPVAPSVVEAMTPFFATHYGNPSSSHSMGRASSEAIEDSRSKVASLLGCDRKEILFTSGGTESNNLAIKGVMMRGRTTGVGHIVISAIEHPATTRPVEFLKRFGYEVSVVGCDADGCVQPSAVRSALRRDTRLVSIMHANNEIGTIQPIREIASICHQHDILVHTDASQSAGKIPVQIDQLDVDLLTIAGHKFYGPKGVGALFVREGLELEPLLHGAGHENGLRAGTENTPYIVALGQAAYLVEKCLDESSAQMTLLRDRLEDQLTEAIPGLIVNGANSPRLPNTSSVSFPGVSGYDLLQRVPEICCSTSSACHSDGTSGSVTLAAMGASDQRQAGKVRLSVGWYTSVEEIDLAASKLIGAWEEMTG